MATRIAETNRVVSLGDDDIEAVLGSSDAALVECYTEWCHTCTRTKPGLELLAEDSDVTVLTIDIESNLETAIQFGAQSAPTFVLFADGRPVKQLRGGRTEQSLHELIARYSD